MKRQIVTTSMISLAITCFGTLSPWACAKSTIPRESRHIILKVPNTPTIEKLARTLNAERISDSRVHDDSPIILVAFSNLAQKGRREAFFTQLQSARLCGALGCATTVFLKRNGKWSQISDEVTGEIRVLSSSHRGLHDLGLSRGRRLIWNGKDYFDPNN